MSDHNSSKPECKFKEVLADHFECEANHDASHNEQASNEFLKTPIQETNNKKTDAEEADGTKKRHKGIFINFRYSLGLGNLIGQ